MLMKILVRFNDDTFKTSTGVVHGTTIEIVWTLVPALILIVIAVPSFSLLYAVDEVVNPSITIKIVGNQWYWNYQYSDYESEEQESISFDSYILPESDLSLGNLRLLEVDNRVVLPVDTHIRLVVTSADVLHCWTIPSFGVKIDACPGRLNEASLFVERQGVFYGQCSEICGINHGFIPIAVEILNIQDYIAWVSLKLEEA
jgi:cytochrome c oxidase subunit 2